MASSPHERMPDRTAPAAERLLALHRACVLLRAVDEATARLALAGKCGTHLTLAGTEAVLAGTGLAMQAGDWALPGPRQSAIALVRGAGLHAWLAQALGRCTDPSRGRQEPGHGAFRAQDVVSPSTPVGSQLVHAVGVARSMRMAGRGHAAVALAGHGACATADFHVALNFAGLWRVPAVFVIARTQGLAGQTATDTIAVKGQAYGVPAEVVDGADAAEVEHAVSEALERARDGAGPTLLDVTCPHPAPPKRLRLVAGEADARRDDDPLERLAARLAHDGVLDAQADRMLRDRIAAEVEAAAADTLRLPEPPRAILWDDVFARRTPALEGQRREGIR